MRWSGYPAVVAALGIRPGYPAVVAALGIRPGYPAVVVALGIRRLEPLTIGGQVGGEPVHKHEDAGNDDPDQGAINAGSCSGRFNRLR
jgi:hypothetical protein